MVRKSNKVASVQEEVVAQEVATTEAPATKTKKVRYAPVTVLTNDKAIISFVAANPKRAGSAAHGRYGEFHRVGQTVGEYVAAYKARNLAGMLARNDLRWDLEHGFIQITAPQGE